MKALDLTGQKYGELTVVSFAGKNEKNINQWNCMCSCGGSKTVPTPYLRSGDTSTCGAALHVIGVRHNPLEGRKFHRLFVKSFSHSGKRSMSYYRCVCECGTEKVLSHAQLISGGTKSCGCYAKENPSGMTHGRSNTKVYNTWIKVRERCNNVNSPDYADYAGKLHPLFQNSFDEFYKEIGDPPSAKHSIDRIDNSRGYEPGNIRWATPYQQARNKGMNINNSSGVTGVYFYHSGKIGHSTYAVATWVDLAGHTYNKKFSVRRHGLLPAFKMAAEYRVDKIKHLNQQGAGYTENHGK